MNNLKKLYAIIQNSKELGLKLAEDFLRQTDQLEYTRFQERCARGKVKKIYLPRDLVIWEE